MTTPLLSRPAFDDLGAVIGSEKLLGLVDRFVAALRTAFAGEGRSHADHEREAHTLISMSGMLGCERLSLACRALELVAKQGDDLSQPLAEIRHLRDRTVEALENAQAHMRGAA